MLIRALGLMREPLVESDLLLRERFIGGKSGILSAEFQMTNDE
jgi:hypothetical protein